MKWYHLVSMPHVSMYQGFQCVAFFRDAIEEYSLEGTHKSARYGVGALDWVLSRNGIKTLR